MTSLYAIADDKLRCAFRNDHVVAADVELRSTDQQFFRAVIELIYGLGNMPLHGKLQPRSKRSRPMDRLIASSRSS
jgi:hypothetical protein